VGRRTPMLLGLIGFALAALAMGLYVGLCDGPAELEFAAYIAGAGLVGGALILRYRFGVIFSILVLLAVGAVAFLGAVLVFFAAFARCFGY
ncbi:hypothetical protein JYK22_11520, partial [Nonomuraea sp. RK-328]|nr:hypothetical protein [Nonomuraea sp. RK-328]